jgi:2-dehydropantoate 2-reductase
MSGVRHSDTHVEYELDTETWLGPFAGTTSYEQAQEIEALLVSSGLCARAFPDLRPAQWSKLIFNATVNTVAALTDLPHVGAFAAVDAQTDLGRLVRDLMDEGKAVAAAAGVELHEDPWEMNVHAVQRGETLAAEGHYAHVPSMLEDVRSGRPTEVDFITGALVREAERHGVPVPLHTAMYRLVKARECA